MDLTGLFFYLVAFLILGGIYRHHRHYYGGYYRPRYAYYGYRPYYDSEWSASRESWPRADNRGARPRLQPARRLGDDAGCAK